MQYAYSPHWRSNSDLNSFITVSFSSLKLTNIISWISYLGVTVQVIKLRIFNFCSYIIKHFAIIMDKLEDNLTLFHLPFNLTNSTLQIHWNAALQNVLPNSELFSFFCLSQLCYIFDLNFLSVSKYSLWINKLLPFYSSRILWMKTKATISSFSPCSFSLCFSNTLSSDIFFFPNLIFQSYINHGCQQTNQQFKTDLLQNWYSWCLISIITKSHISLNPSKMCFLHIAHIHNKVHCIAPRQYFSVHAYSHLAQQPIRLFQVTLFKSTKK